MVARARWILDSPSEVMRWYQLHTNYLGARFREPMDLVSIHDAFDLAPKMAELWGSYSAKLHEKLVRFSVGVKSNARVRLTVNTSGARYGIPTTEATTVEEAAQEITGFYRNYHSCRWVGDLLVLRLLVAPSRAELAELNRRFAGIVASGSIRLTGPFPPERTDDDHVELPRVAFRFDRYHFGQLRTLIDALNECTG